MISPVPCGNWQGCATFSFNLYWDVDDQMVYDGVRSELGDFQTFVGHIITYLE
jgi:hypothetical protein